MKSVRSKFPVFVICLSVILFGIMVTSFAKSNEYYSVSTITLPNGKNIDKIVIKGLPIPSVGYERGPVKPLESNLTAGINILANVPAFNWSFGPTPTSAAMIAGYYDRTGYSYMYTGPTNGGVMPMDNSAWPDWIDSHGDTRHQCPLSATHNGLDGRTIRGHVDDYWIWYGNTELDPFITGGWPEHAYGECLADYMGSSQSAYGLADGATWIWNYTNGSPLHYWEMPGYGLADYSGMYGIYEFCDARGYAVAELYNQYILGWASPTIGFTYDQYKAEIDAGRPVMIHIQGHSMVGVGYDDSSDPLMYIHDTWDYDTHEMTWGGSYQGLDHYGVTVVQLGSEAIIDRDYGDLNSKPTFLAENGPRHATQELWLGTNFDLESDSRGYENDNPTDDGVVFLGSGPVGGPYTMPYKDTDPEGAIKVTVSGNDIDDAYVSAWFDQNLNCNFADASDNIVNDALVYVVPGVYTFTFPIYPYLPAGDSPFRIRVSPTPLGVSGYAGYVYDGEVEDYLVPNGQFGFVYFDIKPQSLPNPLVTKSKGVLPVAILGSEYFDVKTIDPVTVLLEGVVPPLRWNIEDVATPDGDLEDDCNATTAGADGYDDLTLKFAGQEIVAHLGPVNDGDVIVLTVTGNLLNGTPIEGHDCVIIKSKGEKNNQSISGIASPKSYALYSNYPNPFNPITNIEFDLPKSCDVTLKIFNVLGEEMATLVSDKLSAGSYSYDWDASNMASGVYLYRLEAEGFIQTKKMILMR